MAVRERLPVRGRGRGVGMYRKDCLLQKGNGSGVERKGGGEWRWVGKVSDGMYYTYTLLAQPLAPSPLAQKGIRREK